MSSGPVNRRIFLQRAFAFSAAASLTGCAAGVTSTLSQIQNAPSTPAAQVDGPIDVLMIGDWGWSQDDSQSNVAAAMESYIAQQGLSLEALLLLGDNFYDN